MFWKKILGFSLLAAMLAGTGCSSSSRTVSGPYRPDDRDRDPAAWGRATGEAERRDPNRSVLKRGDGVTITLRDIPTAYPEIIEVIDDRGCVNLPLIGNIKLEGKTTSEAETLIERAYISGRYFKRITAIVVGQADNYFVRGEVKQEGRFPLSGDLTLSQAIASAAGFTSFANRKAVQIVRGDTVYTHNMVRIDKRQDPDPLVKPKDIILVPRSLY